MMNIIPQNLKIYLIDVLSIILYYTRTSNCKNNYVFNMDFLRRIYDASYED